MRNVHVGSARVAVRAKRTAEGRTEVEVLDADGIRIVTPSALPPGQDALTAGFRAMLRPNNGQS